MVCNMFRFYAVIVLGCVSFAQLTFAAVKQEQEKAVSSPSQATTSAVSPSYVARGGPSLLSPLPKGKSTVIGGAIQEVDPVRDELTLKVFGGKKLKILFDARTRLYRDGARIPLAELHAENHASVETVLDGTSVFATTIHILSHSPEGECQGQVQEYSPATRELTMSATLSREPIRLRVPADATIHREGQDATSNTGAAGPSDLVKGTLIHVKFQSGKNGSGVARDIAILASPGTTFVFRGNVAFLDLHSGMLVVADPRDGKSYKISFDPERFSVSRKLHTGDKATVTTTFNGTAYVASEIAVP